MDIFFNEGYDLELLNDDLRMTTPEEDVPQRIKAYMQLNQGEWYLNTSRGLPYTNSFVEPNIDLAKVDAIIRGGLLTLEGVESIDSLELDLNKKTRTLKGTITYNKVLRVEV